MNHDEMHEITLSDLDDNTIGEALQNVSASIEEGHQHLENLQNLESPGFSEYEKRQNLLQQQAQDMLVDIRSFTNEAIEERTYISEEPREEPSIVVKDEKEEQNVKKINIPPLDVASLKKQIYSFGYQKSVVKVVLSNVRKMKRVVKNHFAVFAVSIGLIGSVTHVAGINALVQDVIEWSQEGNVLKDALEYYRLNVFEENRSDIMVQNEQPIYEFYMKNMITSLHEKYDGDSFVTWYFYYTTFMNYGGEYALNNNMVQILNTYNKFYHTDYVNMEDFLIKNGFQDESEFREYVTLQIEAWKERKSRGV